ncbi:hypothetical protein EX30DRAFT_367411 [Ascodesmis nigricans]|uniref:Uncharacterized protein n=1 Tax=Ascodesmis nigricans TaxID=341454 RepID=A0A4S2MPJ4_9PEZI|nr:hypothetical protein EX30DRAFT_367411 [Ascodesmis nigricans]
MRSLLILPFLAAALALPSSVDIAENTLSVSSPFSPAPATIALEDSSLQKRDARKFGGDKVNGSKAHEGFGEKRNGAGKNVRPGKVNKRKSLSTTTSSSDTVLEKRTPKSPFPKPPKENSHKYLPPGRAKKPSKQQQDFCGGRSPLPRDIHVGKRDLSKRALEDITNIPRPPRPAPPQPQVTAATTTAHQKRTLKDITNRPKPVNPNPPPIYGEVHKRSANPEAQCPGGCCRGGGCSKKGRKGKSTLNKRSPSPEPKPEAEPQCPGGCCGRKGKCRGKGKSIQPRHANPGPEPEAQCPGGCCRGGGCSKKGRKGKSTLNKRSPEAGCPGGCCRGGKCDKKRAGGRGKELQKRTPVLEDITNIPRPVRPAGGTAAGRKMKRGRVESLESLGRRDGTPLGDVTNVPRPERPAPRPTYPGVEN